MSESRAGTNGAHRPDAEVLPNVLAELLDARDPAACTDAWAAFVARYSRLLLHVARNVMPARDSAMDAYAYLLERLRRDDCRVLRGYVPDGRSRFTTWLVVVARRSCVDFFRQRYGRPRGEPADGRAAIERRARNELASYALGDADLALLADSAHPGPEAALRSQQLYNALEAAVAGLSPEDRLLIRLRFEDDLSAARIASVLAIKTPFHVYRRLQKICEELRRRLHEHGVEGSAP